MFSRMPSIFWVGTGIMYGWFLLFFILEITVTGFPLISFMGVPAAYLYNAIIGLWVLNMIVAFVLYRAEEAREERVTARESAKEIKSGVVGSTPAKS
jgi:hypothetical protein